MELNHETRGGGSTGYESASKTRTLVLFVRCSPSKEEFTRCIVGAIAINPVGPMIYGGERVRIVLCTKGSADKYADSLTDHCTDSACYCGIPNLPFSSSPSPLLAFSSSS